MTFVLKRRSKSSIKTGIAWKVLLKLCLYFRIPFEMYSHCICENWKVHNIWDLLDPLLCTHTSCNLPQFSSQIKFETAFFIPIQLDKASCSISLVKWEPLTHLTLTTGKSPVENKYQDKSRPTVVLPSHHDQPHLRWKQTGQEGSGSHCSPLPWPALWVCADTCSLALGSGGAAMMWCSFVSSSNMHMELHCWLVQARQWMALQLSLCKPGHGTLSPYRSVLTISVELKERHAWVHTDFPQKTWNMLLFGGKITFSFFFFSSSIIQHIQYTYIYKETLSSFHFKTSTSRVNLQITIIFLYSNFSFPLGQLQIYIYSS